VPDRGSVNCRAILDGRIFHIRDLSIEPDISEAVRHLGRKTQVSIPMMRDGRAIGALSTVSMRVDGVTDNQIELLRTFAEQAVIAITSAETYRALQIRTSNLQETLEYQTTTSDVLKVISRSAFDLQPVLDTVVTTAARLCGAEMAAIARREAMGSLPPLQGRHAHLRQRCEHERHAGPRACAFVHRGLREPPGDRIATHHRGCEVGRGQTQQFPPCITNTTESRHRTCDANRNARVAFAHRKRLENARVR
jgi:hypothetical protein